MRIDVLGPPGVGKTTILNQLIKSGDEKSDWKLQDRALFEIFLKSNISLKEKVKIAYPLRRITIIKRFINAYPVEEFNNEVLRKHFHLIESKVNSRLKDEKYPEFSRIKSIYKYQLLLKEIYLIFKYQKNDIVFSDESITHHTKFSELSKSYEIEGDKKLILPDLVFHITSKPNIIVDRIIQRRDNGRIIDRHKKMNMEQLTLDTETVIHSIKNKSQLLSELGVPTVNIDGTDSMNTISEKVYNSIEKVKTKV